MAVMTRRALIPVVLLVAVLLCGSAIAVFWSNDQPSGRVAIDVASLGPQVGERVPDFRLVDQAGQVRTLQSILGPRGAILLFHRSADW